MRIGTMLFSFVLIAVFFQNCGQPGQIVLQNQIPEPPASDIDTLKDPQPDSVTLISNPSLVINDGSPLTNSVNVTLRSDTIGAEEMLISHLPDCSSNLGWISFAQQTSWVLPANNKDVSIYAKFRKKNAPESICVKASILHDNQPPVIVLTQPPPKFTKNTSVNVTFSATDHGSGIDKVLCKPSNGAEIECSDVIVLNSLSAEGSYSVTIRAVDNAGNVSESLTDAFVVDRTAPVVSVNGPTGIAAQANPRFIISATDDNGLAAVGCRLLPIESDYKNCSALSIEYSNLPSGAYTLDVVATDWAGNSGTAKHSYENDISVPTVSITKAPLAIGNSLTAVFEFSGISGVKDITKFMCSLNGTSLAPCSSPTSYRELSDKEYVFSVVGTNAANVTSSAQNYKFIVDTVPPVLSIVSAPSGIIKSKNVTVALDASDLNGIQNIQCVLNNVAKDCTSKSIAYTELSDQNVIYTFYAVATDRAGNQSSTSPISWIIDNTPDSQILARMRQNPVPQDNEGILDITLTQVSKASYRCQKISDGTLVTTGSLEQAVSSIKFNVTEDIRCDVTGTGKYNKAISVSAIAEVSCGAKNKESGRCVDFKCLSVIELPYSKTLKIPSREQSNGMCYVVKIFNAIEKGTSSLSKQVDLDVISRDHDLGDGRTRNPYILDKDLINFTLDGRRVVKLAGGKSDKTPILVDNFVLVGLYPKNIEPIPAHFGAHGTLDSVTNSSNKTLMFKNTPVVLKPFGDFGTATVAPLDIVRDADVNLSYTLDIRALDCGGIRELSTVYLLFQ